MKRPLCLTGFSYLAAMTAAAFMSRELCFALAAVMMLALLTAAFAIRRGRMRLLCVLGAAAAALTVMGTYLHFIYYPRAALDGMTAEISGSVSGLETGSGRAKYSVRTDFVGIDGAPQHIPVVLTGYGDYDLRAGDRVTCRVKLYAADRETALANRLYMRSRGMALYGVFAGTPEIERAGGRGLLYLAGTVRERLRECSVRLLPGWRGGMLAAMVMGDRRGLNDEVVFAFRTAGMSHMLAISGMHMVAVTGAIDALLSRTEIKKRGRSAVMAAAVVLYTAAAGAGLSVLRAGFMLICRYTADSLGKRYDTLSALSLAVIAVLALDPMAAADPGFLMSVLGCLAIVTLSVPFSLWAVRKLPEKLSSGAFAKFMIQSLSVAVCAWGCTSPVAALTFGSLSLVGVPANIIASPFAFLTVVTGVPASIFAAAGFWPLAKPLAGVSGLAETVMLAAARMFSALPFAAAPFSQPWLMVWLLGTAALVFMPAAVKKSWEYLKYSVVLSAVVLLTGMLSNSVLMRGVEVLEILPLSEGTAAACSKDGSSVLIVCGMTAGDDTALRELALKAGGETEAFVSLGGDPSAELKAVNRLKPETAAMSGAAAERYSGASESGRGTLTFWSGKGGGAKAVFISEGVYGIETDGMTVLYISGDCDIMKLPVKLRRADIVLLDGAEPVNMQALGCRWLLTYDRRAPFPGADRTIAVGSGGMRFMARGNVLTGR